MRRILVVHWPTARRTAGSSFGPITMSATTPMRTISFQSNIASQAPSAAGRGALAICPTAHASTWPGGSETRRPMMCIVIASRDARERARFDPSSRYGHTAFAAGAGFDTKAELFQRQPECPTGHLTRTDPDHEHTRSAEKMYKPVERCFENPERGPGPGDECHVVLTARNMADPRC